MKTLTAFLAALVILQTPAFADAYMKSKMMGGMGTSEVWTGGKKQRMAVEVPGMSGTMVPTIHIVRPDKGVEWEISPDLKAYSEHPIALDYKEEPKTKEDEEAEKIVDDMLKNPQAQSGEEDNNCTSTKLPGRTIAGFQAEGFQSTCKQEGGGASSTTFWLSADSEARAKKIQKEISAFDEARAEAMYAKYPAKERERTKKMMKLMGTAMAKGMMGISGTEKMPLDRLALGMDGGGQGEEGAVNNTMMEVIQAEEVPSDASRYEIPEGYAKVDNVQALQAQKMMDGMANGDMKMSDLANGLGQMGKSMGMTGETSVDQNSEEVKQADQMFQNSAQFVKEQQQLQGVAPVQQQTPAMPPLPQAQADPALAAIQQASSKSQPEAWQQGLYDQRAQQPQQIPVPQNYPQQGYPPQQGYAPQQGSPQQQGYAPAPPRRRSAGNQLQQVQGILASVQGIASTMNGGGGGMDMSSFGQNSGYSEDSGDSGDSGSSEDQGTYEQDNGSDSQEYSESSGDTPSDEDAQQAYDTLGRYIKKQNPE